MESTLSNQQVAEFLRKQTLIKGITDEELSYLVDVVDQVVVGPSEVIFPEGDHSTDLYFIYEGGVSIIKHDPIQNKEYVLNTLKEGSFFGDLAFLDGEARSSTVKSTNETRLLKLSKEISYAQSSEMTNIYNKILSNIAKVNMNRLRETNQSYIEKMGTEISFLKKLVNHGQLFLVSVLLLWGVNILISSIENPVLQRGLLITIVTGLLTFIIYKYYGSFSHYGFNLQDLKKNFMPGLYISAMVLFIVGILYAIGELLIPVHDQVGWLSFASINWNASILFLPIYAFFAEFIYRGVIQTSLRDFLQVSHANRQPVIYSSAIIALLSLPLGVVWALITFFINYALGILYDRYPQLLGVALLHATINLSLVLLGILPQRLIWSI